MKYESGLKKIKKSRQSSANGSGKKHIMVDKQMMNSLKILFTKLKRKGYNGRRQKGESILKPISI